MKLKKSTALFIAAAIIVVLDIVVTSIGFATARTEAELIARAQGNSFWWIILGAVIIAASGFMLRHKGE